MPRKPHYVYLIMYDGKARGFSGTIPTRDEIDTTTKELVGAWCLKPEDYADQERYIFELETILGN